MKESRFYEALSFSHAAFAHGFLWWDECLGQTIHMARQKRNDLAADCKDLEQRRNVFGRAKFRLFVDVLGR